jgi:hypothetical protein
MARIKIEDLAADAQELSSKQMGAVIGGTSPFRHMGTSTLHGRRNMGFSRWAERTVTVQRDVQVTQRQRRNWTASEYGIGGWAEVG